MLLLVHFKKNRLKQSTKNFTMASVIMCNIISQGETVRWYKQPNRTYFLLPSLILLTLITICNGDIEPKLNYDDATVSVTSADNKFDGSSIENNQLLDKDNAKSSLPITDLGFIHAFLASISVILVSELGDKTFFIAAIMAMRHSRINVFVGAISALALMTILSAVFGMAATIIPRVYTYWISTALFAIFGLKMLKDGYYMSANEAQEELEEVQSDLKKREDELIKSMKNDGNSSNDLRGSTVSVHIHRENENFDDDESDEDERDDQTRSMIHVPGPSVMNNNSDGRRSQSILSYSHEIETATSPSSSTVASPVANGDINANGMELKQLGSKKRLEKETSTSLIQDAESGIIRKNKQRNAAYVYSRVFMQAFTMTFLAEWGDRSQVTTIILSAREDVMGVIVGGVLGHSLCTGLAVIGGRMIAQKISVRTVTLIGGVVFLLFAVSALFFNPEEN